MNKRKSIFRAEKNRNYSVICNECFRDSSLSARAKGVFAYIMTLPDDWEIHKSELHTHFTEGRDAINGALRELEVAGYISKRPRQIANGQMMGWDYTVREKPEKPENNRLTENPSVGRPATTKYLSSENTERRNEEQPSASRRSTGSRSNRKGPATPSGAPWAGRSYNGVSLPQIESYEDIEAISDPILAAMAVTGERGVNGFGHWVSVLNGVCAAGMPLDMAVRMFRFCVSKLYGEMKAGEIVNPGAALNKELSGAFG